MESTRIRARPIGRWGMGYLQKIIAESPASFQLILKRADLTKGRMFVYAPPEVPTERLKQVESGGVVPPQAWLPSGAHVLSQVPNKMLENYLWQWLKGKQKTTASLSPASNRLLLGGMPLWYPTQLLFYDSSRFLTYNDAQYAWVCDRDDAPMLQSLVDSIDAVYPPLLLCGIVGHNPMCSVREVELLLWQWGTQECWVDLIVAGVYDGESFLIWR